MPSTKTRAFKDAKSTKALAAKLARMSRAFTRCGYARRFVTREALNLPGHYEVLGFGHRFAVANIDSPFWSRLSLAFNNCRVTDFPPANIRLPIRVGLPTGLNV